MPVPPKPDRTVSADKEGGEDGDYNDDDDDDEEENRADGNDNWVLSGRRSVRAVVSHPHKTSLTHLSSCYLFIKIVSSLCRIALIASTHLSRAVP